MANMMMMVNISTTRVYFSLVLLALVDTEYKFLWVSVGASGSLSDDQIFNRSKLRRRIENRTLGLPPPERVGPGGGGGGGGGKSTLLPPWGTMALPLCLDLSSRTTEDN